MDGPAALFLPHTKTPIKDWGGLFFGNFTYVFMHQTAPGSIASNGQEMQGEALPSLSEDGGPKIYSGDIHVPQTIGSIEYIGSPYHVHFGDRFTPRCILIDKRGRAENLYFPTISRVTVTVSSMQELHAQKLAEGDQIKLRFNLSDADKHQWFAIRRAASDWLKSKHVDVHGVELRVQPSRRRLFVPGEHAPGKRLENATDAVLRYVTAEELTGDALDMGLELVV
jgi:hypothetical protein